MSQIKPKILICTGIYPPHIGGPATYAKNLKETLREFGYSVRVKTFTIERKLPTGVRHLFYFFKILPAVISSDFIIALDTFSVGIPAVLSAKLFRKKIVIRTGGDFLHEQYLERTKELIVLDDFYKKERNFNLKERTVLKLTSWTLRNADALVFSSEYQRDIFMAPYNLKHQKIFIIENFYGGKLQNNPPANKNFLHPVRNLVFKNEGNLDKAFTLAKTERPEIRLEKETYPHEELMEKIKNCYAVILPSLNDISPNLILETIRFSKPFIITKNNGLNNRIKDIALYVDPLDIEDIKDKILFLANEENYEEYKKKLENFNFSHSYSDIAKEFLEVYKKLDLSR